MTPVVWIVVQCEGRTSEPWKCYDNESAAREWVEAVHGKPSANVSYEIYPLAVLTNAFV